MTDYKLLYTNLYGDSNANKAKPQQMDIEGDCIISNYDTNGTKPKGSIKVECKNKSIFIKEGRANDKTKNVADFSKKKALVLEEIAALDGDNKLSQKDIEKLNSSYIKKWNIESLEINATKDKVTIKWGKSDILIIDFSKEKVKSTQEDNFKPINSPEYAQIFDCIPKEYNDYISRVAKNAKVSEDLVRFFILNECEAGTKKAALTAYKKKGDVWTIGFGHTNLCRKNVELGNNKNFKVKEGETISLKEAFNLLEGDIIAMREQIYNTMKNRNIDFYAIPQSVREMMIDYAFQCGANDKLVTETSKENLKNGYYSSYISGTLYDSRYTQRSARRFMLGLRDLNSEQKKKAMKRFVNKGYYNTAVRSNLLSAPEKKFLIERGQNLESK